MIWVENDQFLLACTNTGALQVISITNNALRIKQTFMVNEDIIIYSLQLSIKNPNEILLSSNNGVIFVKYTYSKIGQQFKFIYEPEDNPPLFVNSTIQGLLQYGNYLLVAINGEASLSLYNRDSGRVEKKIPVPTGSKEFFGIRAISEDLAIVKDSLFITAINLKKQVCFPLIQILLNDSTGTHDYYLET